MNNTEKFLEFRQNYPVFIYEKFEYEIEQIGLKIKFTAVREDLITEEIKEFIGDILSVKPIEYKIW